MHHKLNIEEYIKYHNKANIIYVTSLKIGIFCHFNDPKTINDGSMHERLNLQNSFKNVYGQYSREAMLLIKPYRNKLLWMNLIEKCFGAEKVDYSQECPLVQ